MAITAHAKTTLKLNEGKAIDATARSAVFGAEATGGDYKTLFIFNNTGSSAVTATIAVGDGIQGAGSDLVVSCAGSKTTYLVVDSGYFKNVSGEYKDYIKVTPSASLSVTIVELPQ